MKNFYTLFSLFFFNFCASAQIVNIPDANFKAKLLEANETNNIAQTTNYRPTKIDLNENGEIELSEALLIRALNINNANINSLTGIESFTALRRLDCSNNSLTSLDVNSLTLLRILNCSRNSLTVLNCQNINNTMDWFNCSYNNLTSLALPNFFEFQDQGDQTIFADCSHNELSSVAFAANEQLSHLNLSYNNLASLEFGHLEVYGFMDLSNNPLANIDFENVYMGAMGPDETPYLTVNNTNITELYVPFRINAGSSISNNPNLVHLNIKNSYTNYTYYYETGPDGEETGNILYYGLVINDNPQLALICCDSNEISYYRSIVPDTVQVTQYCNFTPGGNYNVINGNVTYNCPGSTPVNSNVKVVINNQYNASFAEDGNYTAYTSYGTQNVSLQFLEPNYFTVTPPNYSIQFVNTGNSRTADFCVSPNGIHPDLEITILPMTTARPGFDAQYKLIVKNKGTETQSGTVSFSFNDTILDYVSSFPTATSQSNSLLTWNFSELAPFEDKEISITLNVNSPTETPAVNLGDVLHLTAAITSGLTDETPADNQYQLDQTVIGSFDPNDKTVLEGSQVSIAKVGDYLHYLIRFQNTGTAAAENVVVSDLLHLGYDINSLQIISASHPFKTQLRAGYWFKLEFIFEDINLPASSIDEAGSHGYIAFRIKPNASTAVGAIIENKAEIYFDFNFPIITNTVSTTFTALGVSEPKGSQFRLYPNPTSGILNIAVSDGQQVNKTTINNLLGQTVLVSEGQNRVDVGSLVKGTYLVTVETDSGKQTQKMIKL